MYSVHVHVYVYSYTVQCVHAHVCTFVILGGYTCMDMYTYSMHTCMDMYTYSMHTHMCTLEHILYSTDP